MAPLVAAAPCVPFALVAEPETTAQANPGEATSETDLLRLSPTRSGK
jgi:hypothetical protein